MARTKPLGDPMEPWLKVLRVFVVVAGVALVLGSAAFFYLFVKERERARAAANASEHAPAAPVRVPANSRVVDVRYDAGRALTLLADDEGRSYLLLVDMMTGRRLGLVVLAPEAP